MGTTFRYIRDDAMFPCGGSVCHFCESDRSPVFTYNGIILHPELAANPALAREEPEISELCGACILSENVRKEIEPVIEATINRFARDRRAALDAFHRTPDIPLFLQYQDWPMCCGDWCEFVGVPASYDESVLVPSGYRYWEREPKPWETAHEMKPESLREISLFRCLLCNKKTFTWQFT